MDDVTVDATTREHENMKYGLVIMTPYDDGNEVGHGDPERRNRWKKTAAHTQKKARFAFEGKTEAPPQQAINEFVEEARRESGGNPATSKTVKTPPTPPTGANIAQINICQGIKPKNVTVRKFGGRVYVDIREFYLLGGQTLPTKKGITLTEMDFKKIQMSLKKINAAIYKGKNM
ncbi:RNA polymerase II transcriptional coactivator KELP-like [Lytechinus variegatus]|uniref:RNA polymerase II transcriptional coactivator KELP-like n=1 Tax=Lytechinus variegatus TaxID=7654 RepID=UPI001BB0F0D1|nr:RNA polymerase II transcriptional coactivator KELP-like [Lytechinus variegatus]